MELHKLGVKLFVEPNPNIDLLDFITIFHRWIQTRALDEYPIDVADYSHVPDGPGIMLIAREGNYAFDETGGRQGMVYYAKRPLDGDFPTRLTRIFKRTLQVCQLLEGESALKGRLRFLGNELQIFANDRLLAPNNQITATTLMPMLGDVLVTLFAGKAHTMDWEANPKERFSVIAKTPEPVSISELLNRLA
ncbi:MAG: hypothetical protein H6969_03000 [Gammaproteobacteria bacterium]|nr:hypothetical protein [Gammaproteobacteria bacterium]MCP5460065.1 hypothetical protein [Gammaproteobacteria bacterium]